MKIKICGLTRPCDIEYVNEANPDYIGFVFAKSKREVSHDQASSLKQNLSKYILTVGVFVDADIDRINRLVDKKVIDIVQLHGNESDAYISKINAPIIKAVRLGESCNRLVDYFLFDSAKGGSGKVFDWKQLPKPELPFFLAGGINLENIGDAIKLNPYAIDVSSGIETDGFKDKNKILEIIRRVRNE